MIFKGSDEKEIADKDKDSETVVNKNAESSVELDGDSDASEEDSESTEDGTATDGSIGKKDNPTKDEGSNATNELDEDSSDDSIGVIKPASDEDIVSETIVDSTWQPIVTEQVGEHVSSYERESIDWIEKQKAIAYATGESSRYTYLLED